MDIKLSPGKYVLAVSGGVDSVALLDMVAGNAGSDIVVAHFDHGIRQESADDARFVSKQADAYGLPFMTERVELGADASEDRARSARYEFLRRVMKEQGAQAIVTAHHQDDLLETMVMQLMRGTGRRGLDPMRRRPDVLRPLLPYSKDELIQYARSKKLAWREDSTNTNTRYARNHVRQLVMPKLGVNRQLLVTLNAQARVRNDKIDTLLLNLEDTLLDTADELNRSRFVRLPYCVATEFVHWWLSKNDVKDLDATVVMRATIAAKTLMPGKKINLGAAQWLQSEATSLKIISK